MMMNPLLGPEAGPIGKARSPSVNNMENASKNRRFEDVLAAGAKSDTQVPDPAVVQEQPGDSPAQAKPGEVAAEEEGRSVKGAETGSDVVRQSDVEAGGHAEFAGRTSTVGVRSVGSSNENAKTLGEAHVERAADRLEDARHADGADTAVGVSDSSQTSRTERGQPEPTDTAEINETAVSAALAVDQAGTSRPRGMERDKKEDLSASLPTRGFGSVAETTTAEAARASKAIEPSEVASRSASGHSQNGISFSVARGAGADTALPIEGGINRASAKSDEDILLGSVAKPGEAVGSTRTNMRTMAAEPTARAGDLTSSRTLGGAGATAASPAVHASVGAETSGRMADMATLPLDGQESTTGKADGAFVPQNAGSGDSKLSQQAAVAGTFGREASVTSAPVAAAGHAQPGGSMETSAGASARAAAAETTEIQQDNVTGAPQATARATAETLQAAFVRQSLSEPKVGAAAQRQETAAITEARVEDAADLDVAMQEIRAAESNAKANALRSSAAALGTLAMQSTSVASQAMLAGGVMEREAGDLLDASLERFNEMPGLSQMLTEAVIGTGAGHRPETPRMIAAQIAEAFAAKGEQKVEISLNPQELGRVKMRVATSETGITMIIHTERPETGDLMRRHINELAEEFRRMGYEDISFEFSGGEAEGGHSRSGSDHAAAGGSSGSGESLHDGEAPASEIITQNLQLGAAGLDMRV
ncbi:flagellar hook-length control protein FliK [Nocardioides marinus]|nr:flagellar hook-length control protein FliK [Nocardioides marinus]